MIGRQATKVMIGVTVVVLFDITLESIFVKKDMAKHRQKLQIKVVLDTNAIWTRGESFLLSREMSELVNTNRGDAHVDIQWILPEVVLHERRYQMQREAAALLPSLTRLERVIGHPLNITEEVINDKTSKTVERQVQELQLIVHPASYDHVDWLRLVSDAVNRRPPFEASTEKGFRDAIIAETFIQLAKTSPEQPQRCRIVLLTNDALLAEAVKVRVSERNNVQVLRSADELRGLINTLISAVPEDYVARLQQKARGYFFTKSDTHAGAVCSREVIAAINTNCSEQLAAKPQESTRRSNGPWHLTPPRFAKKEGQRVFWVSRFSVDANAYKEDARQFPAYQGVATTDTITPETTSWSGKLPWQQLNTDLRLTTANWPQSYPQGMFVYEHEDINNMFILKDLRGTERLAFTGHTLVDVHWSVSVNVKGIFSKPKIDLIQFIETTWDNVM